MQLSQCGSGAYQRKVEERMKIWGKSQFIHLNHICLFILHNYVFSECVCVCVSLGVILNIEYNNLSYISAV